jgi:hypothetical protein
MEIIFFSWIVIGAIHDETKVAGIFFNVEGPDDGGVIVRDDW